MNTLRRLLWVGLTAGCCGVVACLLTLRWTYGLTMPGVMLGGADTTLVVWFGAFSDVGVLIAPARSTTELLANGIEFRVLPSVSWFPDRVGFFLPASVWVVAIVFCFAALWRLRSRERADANLCCAKCRYDLTGNVSGVCPECGVPAR